MTLRRTTIHALGTAVLAAALLAPATAPAAAADHRAATAVQTEGGWEQGDLRLDPSENAAVDAYLAEAAEAERIITPQMVRIAEATAAELVGLEHRLKTEDSLKRKLATWLQETPEKPIDEALDEINDSVRYTLQWPEEEYTAGAGSAAHLLTYRGNENVRWRNTWDSEDGYKAINSAWNEHHTGHRFEVQFHTPESHEATTLTHPLYEEQRLPSTSPERVAELQAQQAEIFRAVPVPEGAAELRAPQDARGWRADETAQPVPAA